MVARRSAPPIIVALALAALAMAGAVGGLALAAPLSGGAPGGSHSSSVGSAAATTASTERTAPPGRPAFAALPHVGARPARSPLRSAPRLGTSTPIAPPSPARMFATPSSGTLTTPYRSPPAPMGVSDLGFNKSGAYRYETPSFEGIVTITSFDAFTPTNASNTSSSAPNWVFLQLSTVAVNVSSHPGTPVGSYWIQNGLRFNGTTVRMEDLVANTSAPGAALPPYTLEGTHGRVVDHIYYTGGAPAFSVKLPVTIELFSNVSSTSGGHSVVKLSYLIRSGSPATTFKATYDTVTFNGTASAGPSEFQVNGTGPDPGGFLNDAELTFGGNGGGQNANLLALNGTARLLRWSPTAKAFRAIPSAYDFGADSSETALGIAETYTGTTVRLSQGPSFLEGLWNTTSNAIAPHASPGRIHVHLRLSPSYALAFATNSTLDKGPLADAGFSYAPSDRSGNLTTYLPPPPPGEPYVFAAWADGYGTANVSVSANSTLSLSLTSSPSTLDAPVYLMGTGQGKAFGHAGIDGVTYDASTGKLSLSPRPDNLAAPFLRLNNFDMPTFMLLATAGLNLSLTANDLVQSSASFSNYTVQDSTVRSPLVDWTQGYFFYYGAGHFSVQNTTIEGVPAFTQAPARYPPASIQFFGDSDVSVVNVQALDSAIGVRLFGTTDAVVAHLSAESGAVGLSADASTGLTLSSLSASGPASPPFSVLADLNDTNTVTASSLSASDSATGIVSYDVSGLTVSGYSVLSGAFGFDANATDSATVSDLTVGGGTTSGAGSWVHSDHLEFTGLSVDGTGLVLSHDTTVTVENGKATGSGSSVVSGLNATAGATLSHLVAQDSAYAAAVYDCSNLMLTSITAQNSSLGAYVGNRTSPVSGSGISSTNRSVGLDLNDTSDVTFSGIQTSDLSIGAYVENSTSVTFTTVTASAAALGTIAYFSNVSGEKFPVAAIGLYGDTSVTLTGISATNYPFAVWSDNSSEVAVSTVTDWYGDLALDLVQTNQSKVTDLFAFADREGVVLQDCASTSVATSTFESSLGVGVNLTNTSHITIEDDNFVGNNGSSVDGVFVAAHDQASSINSTAPTFRGNYWSDRPSSASYTINASVPVRDLAPSPGFYSTYLEFSETGLPSGLPWTLKLDGLGYTTAVSDLYVPGWVLTLGTLRYTVAPITGYPAHPPAGNVSWSGTTTTQPIVFGNLGSPSSGLPLWAYGALGGGVAVVVVAAVLFLRGRHRPPGPVQVVRPTPRGGNRQGPPPRRSSEWSPDDR